MTHTPYILPRAWLVKRRRLRRSDGPKGYRAVSINLHIDDLPAELDLGGSIAVDSETMGLQLRRDRLCLLQLSSGDGNAHLVQFRSGSYAAPNLKRLLTDERVTKIFHYARFDLAAIRLYLDVDCAPVYCTKIASKLARTFTDRHSLKDLCSDLLGVSLSKQQQSSDWGAEELTEEQLRYAASDVLYLHALRERLDAMLHREGRFALSRACFAFLPHRVSLDLLGWEATDIFAH